MKSIQALTLVVGHAFLNFSHAIDNEALFLEAFPFKEIQRGRDLTESSLNCMPDADEIIIDTDENLEVVENKFEKHFKKLNTASRGLELVKTMRKQPEGFYQQIVNVGIMAMCEEDISTKKERCVPESSPFAAKNDDNECIVVPGHTCEVDYCEISSNCYWKSPVEGEVRETRFPPEQYALAKSMLRDYSRGSYIYDLVKWTVIGIAVAIVLLVIWLLYFLARYCCCCLWDSCSICCICSPIPREDGYRVCLEWGLPFLLYIVAFIGIIASGCVALVGNGDISAALTATFEFVYKMIDKLGIFLEKSSNPLIALVDIVDEAKVDAFNVFTNTSYVTLGAYAISKSFTDFKAVHAGDLLNMAMANFTTDIDPLVEDISNMLGTLENDVYDNVDSIKSTLGQAISGIGSFDNSTVAWQSNIAQYEAFEDSTRQYRQLAILGLFLLGGTIALAGLLGILTSRKNSCARIHNFMNLAGILSAILGSICLVVASITLLVSFLWYDVCEISNVVAADFEPVLGDTIARGVNSMFRGQSLAEAYKLTEKIDFQEKLDEGLSVLENVNITLEFEKVISPLFDVQESAVDETSAATFELFSPWTSASPNALCPFNDTYLEEDMFEPWNRNSDKTTTSWNIADTNATGTYAQLPGENATDYFKRIYDVYITDPSSNNAKTCAENSAKIQGFHGAYVTVYNAVSAISADLGVTCPSSATCPSEAFTDLGNNDTIVGLITDYGTNLTSTAASLVDITTTSVGLAMTQVQKFLCNMNITFVAQSVLQVQEEVCTSMLSGFIQINWSMWALGIFLEIIAIVANALATRLRGISRAEADDLFMGSSKYSDSKYSDV